LLPPAVPIESTLNVGAGEPIGPEGSVSASEIVSPFVIGSGPLFVTDTVQTVRAPAFTGEGDALFATLSW
jgi:hypothetical protein